MKINSAKDLQAIAEKYNQEIAKKPYQILICGGAGCVSAGCAEVSAAVQEELKETGLDAKVHLMETGCIGTCAVGPVMLIQPDGVLYVALTPEVAKRVLRAHLLDGEILRKHTFYDFTKRQYVPHVKDIEFFRQQVKVALRNCGQIEHASIDAYIARGGYTAAAKAFEKGGDWTVEEVKASGLAGRGGAGFPTGTKLEAGRNAPGDEKYYVCNADEGDPGAFMDRSILEGDPHSIIEGMLIGGYAIGAHTGYVYVRAEYPIAIERLEKAMQQARGYGLLGKNIMGSGFDFEMEVRIGAGAFVCGEETALLNSIEGQRGEPRQKPPFPFQKGLFDMPTIINNVETVANIAPIIEKGAEWFSAIGAPGAARGTKVFALAGDIHNTGIVEIPIGTPMGNIIFDIGGGVPLNKKLKSLQIGGPSGGCITREQLNTPVDYKTLKELGAIMGSGGLIAMNEDNCMVDTARYFMEFIQEESCGKCVSCRLGTKRMLEILERICKGYGQEGDIELLEELGRTVKETAICGLGQTAPNPILSAIARFRDEFEEHVRDKYCRAGVCSDLFISPCENACPAGVNVPGYLALISDGRFADAYSLIRQENPLPAVCGRICTHPCESKCRRRTVDEAVAICDLKRFASDYAHKNEQYIRRDIVFPKNGKQVNIIGAGSAGLTCGYYLARIGYDVDIYEAENVPGGVLAFGIPEYRLPKDVLAHEIELIENEGVNIHLGCNVGRDISFNELREKSDALFVAIGTQYPQRIDLPGEDLDGVIHGIDFLKEVNLGREVIVGKNVVVVGGGNTAVDSARTALRLGAKKVTLIYRRSKNMMPADHEEINEMLDEGVELMPLTQPVEVLGKSGQVTGVLCRKMKLGEFDDSGRRISVPKEEETFILEADTFIPAISQYADLPFIPAMDIGRTSWGTFTIDPDTMMTTMEGVFSGGDIIRGPDSVIQAIADGKKAASEIDRYLGGRGMLNKGPEISIPDKYDDDEVVELERYAMEQLDVDKRKHSFDEVVQGYHKLTAIAESMRCLHCDRRL